MDYTTVKEKRLNKRDKDLAAIKRKTEIPAVISLYGFKNTKWVLAILYQNNWTQIHYIDYISHLE